MPACSVQHLTIAELYPADFAIALDEGLAGATTLKASCALIVAQNMPGGIITLIHAAHAAKHWVIDH